MVHSAAESDCLFLQIAQAGRRLTGVEHMATGILDERLVLMRRSSYAGHTLHDIEHRALYLQQTQFLSVHLKSDIPRLHMIAVMQELLKTAFGVEIVDDFFCHLDTGQHARIFDDELLATQLGRRNTTKRGVVTIADIFFKPDSNKLTKFLFFHIITNYGAKVLQKKHIRKFLMIFLRISKKSSNFAA